MIWLLLLSLLTALATALWPDWTASLIFPVCLFLPLLLWLRRASPAHDRAYLTRVAVLAFSLRVSCAYLVEALRLMDKPDALYYHRIASEVAQYLRVGRFQELHDWMSGFGHPGYQLLVGVEYLIFGPNILLGQNLNALASAFTVVPIYFLSREISPEPRVARLAAVTFAWLPNSVIWSTQLLKDSIIVLLEVTLVLDLVRLLNRRFSAVTVLRLLVVTVLLAELRFYLPVLIYASCGLAYLVIVWQTPGVRRGATGAFVAAVLATALVGIMLTGKMWVGYLQLAKLDQLEGYRWSTMGGDSDFAKGARLDSPGRVLEFLPVGTAYFLAGPAPWEARKVAHYLTWLDIPIWYPTLVLGSAGMILLSRKRQAIPLIGICLGLTLFYSLFLANLGTAYRMRLQVTPLFLIAAACYWYRCSERAIPSGTRLGHHFWLPAQHEAPGLRSEAAHRSHRSLQIHSAG